MDDITLYRPLPFLSSRSHKTMEVKAPGLDMDFNSYKFRSFSTSTPLLTRGSTLDATPKVIRSMSTSYVNDSGFDESFTDCDTTMCVDTPNTVCKLEKRTSVSHIHNDSFLSQSYSPCPFSVKVNKFFETPGATFFPSSFQYADNREQLKNQRQSVSIPLFDLDTEPCEMNVEKSTCTSDLAERFDEVMQRFSPLVRDNLIGRKMGLECVDIISELSDKNISCSTILQYLNPRDLCSMCEVSRKWKSVCDSDPKAKRRKNRFSPYKVITGKENSGKKSPPRPFRGLTEGQTTLSALQFVGQTNKELTPCSVKKDLFQTAASSLKNEEKLRKCPKCSKVSKVFPVQERGKCQSNDCQFDFCVKCFYEFHGARPCVPVAAKKTKTDSIGGKKSKKNLKRL